MTEACAAPIACLAVLRRNRTDAIDRDLRKGPDLARVREIGRDPARNARPRHRAPSGLSPDPKNEKSPENRSFFECLRLWQIV